MMTKKDFNAIGIFIRNNTFYLNEKEGIKQSNSIDKKGLLNELSAYFKSVNPFFDEKKFLTACLK